MTKLKFDLAGVRGLPSGSEVPVEVRKANMSVVAKTLSSDEVQLDPGTYFVTAPLPGGQELVERIKIRGDKAHQTLAFQAKVETTVVPRAKSGNSLWQPLQKALSRMARSALAIVTLPATRNARLRLLSGNLLTGGMEFKSWSDAEWEVESKNVRSLPVSAANAPSYAQLLQPGRPTLNIALPIWGQAHGRLVVRRPSRDDLSLGAEPGHPQATMLLRYGQDNRTNAIAALLVSQALTSRRLWEDRLQNPIAAAAGAYALLRLGELERLEQWTSELMRGFPRLPDGAVVHGEFLARMGDHSEAAATFLRLPELGLPLFADGLAFADERMRLYTNVEDSPLAGRHREAAEDLLQRLTPFLTHTDFAHPVTMFTGLDALRPDDESLSRFTRVEHTHKIGHLF